jgi:hypothetical protein
MFHKYHLLNQLQVFMRYKKLPKMSFNIPLKLLYLQQTKKHVDLQHSWYLGDNCIVFENFTASIGDLMVTK